MADIFIGYSSKDENVAEMLCEALETVGISVWYAKRNIQPGVFIPNAIAEAINHCRICVFVFSKFGVSSEYLSKELGYVISRLNQDERRTNALIPLITDEEGKSVLSEEAMQNIVWWDATKPPLETRFNEFAQFLARRLTKPQKTAS